MSASALETAEAPMTDARRREIAEKASAVVEVSRIEIALRLGQSPATTAQLSKCLGVSVRAVRGQLAVLRLSGYVVTTIGADSIPRHALTERGRRLARGVEAVASA